MACVCRMCSPCVAARGESAVEIYAIYEKLKGEDHF